MTDLIARLTEALAEAIRNERQGLAYAPERLRGVVLELRIDGTGAASGIEPAQRAKGCTTMALETRSRGSVYYYRARKVDGRVVKNYVDAGLAAVAARDADARLRIVERVEAEGRRSALAAFEAEEVPLADLCRRAELLARGTLLGAGYRRHDRGEWRKRRGDDGDEG